MRLLCRHLLPILFICLWTITAAHAQTNLLGNGDFAQGMEGWSVELNGRGTATVVDAQAGPFQKALRFEVRPQAGDVPWKVQLQQVLGVPVKAWDTLALKVWLRSPNSNKVWVFIQEQRGPYSKFVEQELKLTPQWQEYEVSGASLQNLARREAGVGFHLAYAPGVIAVAGVRLFAGPPQPQLDLQLGHGSDVTSVAFSPDEKIVVSSSLDHTIKLWDAANGILQRSSILSLPEWVVSHFRPTVRCWLSPDTTIRRASWMLTPASCCEIWLDTPLH